MEYRVLELDFGDETIKTNPFDFGCSAIMQDHLKAEEKKPKEQRDPIKFTVNIVEAILYRMLENKVVNFSIVKTLPPELITYLFFTFQKWYKADMDYLQALMQSNHIEGFGGNGESSEGDDSLYYIIYMFFKHHNVEPARLKSWKFEEVADILYYSQKEQVSEQVKESGILK